MARSMRLLSLFLPLAAHAALTPAQNCQVGKLKEAAKYHACRLKAEAALEKGTAESVYAEALAKCALKLAGKWQLLEAKAVAGGGACNSSSDLAKISTLVDGATTCAAGLLDGRFPAECPGAPSRLLATELPGCWDANGDSVMCGGTGQDSETAIGVSRDYVSNGDGTITDRRTGLMWEALSDDDSIHDVDSPFTWEQALAKATSLNAVAFAGHSDWRLPNILELESIVSHGHVAPAISAIFASSCDPGCSVTACSCNTASFYWTSTSNLDSPNMAWSVEFLRGATQFESKTERLFVRLVRTAH